MEVVHDLGVFFLDQGRDIEAENMLNRAWALRDKGVGIEHQDTRGFYHHMQPLQLPIMVYRASSFKELANLTTFPVHLVLMEEGENAEDILEDM